MNVKQTALVSIGVAIVIGATVQGAQRGWVLPLKSSARALIVRPQAEIGGRANGIYCTPQTTNGVGVHDLGGLPAGLKVNVTVEALSEGFDPVAAVVTPLLGEAGGNNIKTTNFYDNDSGGDKDAMVSFVTPQAGNYILLVNDHTDKTAGCYRYEVILNP